MTPRFAWLALSAVFVFAGCHDSVQLLDSDTPVVADCEVCTDDVGCSTVPDGTACMDGMCETGECTDTPTGTALLSIAAGEHNTCAIAASGELFCWGDNIRGQVGVGNADPQPLPIMVDVGPWSSIAVGQYHACGLKSDGSLWCWGGNARGQLGLGVPGDQQVPQRVVSPALQWSAIATGAKHACALAADARLYCWGRGTEGQLGLGDGVDSDVPVEVSVGSEVLRSIELGRNFTCAIDSRGSLSCWGENNIGQLGVGDLANRLSPTLLDVGGAVDAVVAGGEHTCALLTSGDTVCFGRNTDGQLGIDDADNDHHETPQTLTYELAFDAVGLGQRHSCGLEGGGLWCWGRGDFGQLGLGDTGRKRSPRKVDAADDWISVVGGQLHTCALRSDGSVYCWGSNASGQLGLGVDPGERSLPTRVDL